jgi:glycyl-tRNA synthetase
MEKYKGSLDQLAALCKRRGFIFQTSEIYGGINGFWDYGPLGVELKRNIKDFWWKTMVRDRDDVVGLDSSIIQHPRTWEASGHVGGFKDPMVDCRETKGRYRTDQVQVVRVRDDEAAPMVAFEDGQESEGRKKMRKLVSKNEEEWDVLPLTSIPVADYSRIIAPDAREPGSLTEPRQFNLMFKTHVGPVEQDSAVAYLRPETAQGIFSQFANVWSVSRQKIPFGIAQIGKAFRNEINPRNYTFRSREFEQMELEFFIRPGSDAEWHERWVAERLKWYGRIGLPESSLHRDIHRKEDLAHYASACTDVAYDFPFGTQELEGIAARGHFDLAQHQEWSGKSMEVLDPETNERFLPHVIEPSAGADRIALAVLCEAYREEWIPKDGGAARPAEPGAKRPPEGHETRTVLGFAPVLAPVKVAVFPLVKNNEELVGKSRQVYDLVRRHWASFYDQGGAIGRRYRRQDEIGTPLGVTVDFDTLADEAVTVRDRDTMEQVRVPIAALEETIAARLEA